MTVGVSSNYRILTADELPAVAAELKSAWQDPSIPRQQWHIVRMEIEQLRHGHKLPHFEALGALLRMIRLRIPDNRLSLLDIGAASGFYSEIISLLGFGFDYQAMDYSVACEALARQLYPGIHFTVGPAESLPFMTDSIDVVLSGCVIIHTRDYAAVIAESARVAKEFVIMNRTPLVCEGPTTFFRKSAYGVDCLEIHYAESELLRIFEYNGLQVIAKERIFTNTADNYGQATYLLKKK